jgi:hypothetical protein
MAFKDALSLCGRIGLIIAAFVFVAGIIAGPLLQKVWSSRVAVTEHGGQSAPLQPEMPSKGPEKQG